MEWGGGVFTLHLYRIKHSVIPNWGLKLNSRYILLSYNNNGKKLQCRSNAKMTDEEIIEILSLRGDVKVFTMGYRGFDAGKSEFNKDNQERIFLCSVNK